MGYYVVTGIESGILNILRLFEKSEMAKEYIRQQATEQKLPLDENGEVHVDDWDIGLSYEQVEQDFRPRPPHIHEIRDLERWYEENYGGDSKESNDLVMEASIAVFDHYITASPGYSGSVMVVVWPSGPEMHDAFYWRRQFKNAPREG